MSAGSPTTPEIKGQIAALKAQGFSLAKIASQCGVSVWVVKQTLKDPQTVAYVKACRAVVKETSAKALVSSTQALHNALKAAIQNYNPTKADARAIDGLARALLNLEKLGSSVSGENKVQPQQPPRLTVTFAGWTTKSGKPETHDMLTGELLEVHNAEDAELVQQPQLPAAGSTAAVDGDDDDADE